MGQFTTRPRKFVRRSGVIVMSIWHIQNKIIIDTNCTVDSLRTFLVNLLVGKLFSLTKKKNSTVAKKPLKTAANALLGYCL